MGKVIEPQFRALTLRERAARLLAEPPMLVVLALCAALLGLRRAQAWSNPQFWAEDIYFFEQAYDRGWTALTQPFAGYLHTILRFIAAVAAQADPALVPGIFVGGASLFTLYVAARTLSARCPLPHFGGFCALAVVLVPDTYEVLLNVVNLQWVLAAGLILLLISRDPARWWQWAHDLAAAAALGLTGPFCIILAPLFAWRAWDRRTRASLALGAVVITCAVVQGYLVHAEPPIGEGHPGDSVAAGLFLPAVARRIGASILLGSLLPQNSNPYSATIMGIATLAGVGYLAFRPGRIRAERIVLGLAFAGMLAGALYRTRYSLEYFFMPLAHARYVFIPQLIAIWLLILAAVEKGRLARIAAALAIWGFMVNVPRYREPAYVDMHWSSYVPRIRAGEQVVVPTNPPGWVLPLPARRK